MTDIKFNPSRTRIQSIKPAFGHNAQNNPMKTRLHCLFIALVLFTSFHRASAQGTAFSYQGKLNSSGTPANGSYDVTFALFNATNGAGQVGGTFTNLNTDVTNGLFAATLDFGPGVFAGANVWLELGVRTNGGAGFTTLAPRQPILPVPYAIMASSASNLLGNLPVGQLSGALPASQLSGTVPLAQLPVAVVTNNQPGVTFNGTVTATNYAAPRVASRTAGENLALKALDGTGSGGALTVNAGNAGVATGGAGGNLTLQAGNAVPQGGAGYSGQGPAGLISMIAGNGYNGVGGNVAITSGPNSPWSLTGNGFSKVSLQGGTLNSGDGASLDVEGGHNPLSNGSAVSSGGNVRITSGNGVGGYPGGNILLVTGTGSTPGNVGIGKANPATALDVNGTITATGFSGNGAGLTNLTLFLGTNVALLNGTNQYTGTNTFSNLAGNGGGLTNLNASQLTSGTVADARLSANVPLLNAANTFSANQTVNGAVGIGVAANAATVLHIVSPNPNARVLFESSVANGNPALVVKANSPAGEADIVADRADTGASAALNLLTGGTMEWTMRTPNFTTGEPSRLDIDNSSSTPVMTLRQNGNVGVGRTSPATALDVNGTVTATGFSGNGAGLTNLTLNIGTNVALLNGTNTFSANQTVNGAVGIGVAANAATVLHIVSPNPSARVLFESSVANGNPALIVKANSPAGEADIVADRADTGASATFQLLTGGNAEWAFRTPNFTSGEPSRMDLASSNSTPIMTFRQNGNVGIGRTSPGTALDVNGTVTATAFSGSGGGLANLNYNNITNAPVIPTTANLVTTNDNRGLSFTNLGNQFVGTHAGNLGGGTNLPLAGLQSGGAVSAQILTWNGSSWTPSNAPAGGGSGLATSGGSGTNETFYGTTTFIGLVTATNYAAPRFASRTAGENLALKALDGTGSGGALTVNAGNAGVATGGAGGNLTLQAGNAVPQGGAGYTGQGAAGLVSMIAGNGYNGVGGNVAIASGPNSPWSLTGNGFSKVSLQGGTLNAGDGASLEVEGGHNPLSNGSAVSSGGSVRITAGNGVGGYPGGNILLVTGTGSTAGNVGIGTNAPVYPLHMASGAYCSVAGVWTSVSDRNTKENFTAITPGEVLAKVAAMPITQWKYKIDPAGVKHIGPMAQDFHAAFGLGDSDRAIGSVDESGVALAAIQGLNEKLDAKDSDIEKLKSQNRSLQNQLDELQAAVRSLAENK